MKSKIKQELNMKRFQTVDDDGHLITFAFCNDCGGSEKIDDVKYARDFVCDECLLENDNK
jgi:hypothetical protein